MNDRRYTVEEIDRMRAVLRWLVAGKKYYLAGAPDWIAPQAEDQLRTHMLNGTRPEELESGEGAGWLRHVEFWKSVDAASDRTPAP